MSVCGRRIIYIIRIPYVKCQSAYERISTCVHNTGCGSRGELLFQIEICYDPPGSGSQAYITYSVLREMAEFVRRSRCEEREICHLFESLSCRKELYSLILDCTETRGVCGLKIEEKSSECTKRGTFREVIWHRVRHNDCWQSE